MLNLNKFLYILILAVNIPNFASAATSPPMQCNAGSPAEDARNIHMIFGGDTVLGNNHFMEHIPDEWESLYFAGVRDQLRKSDIAFANLEGTLTSYSKTLKNSTSGRQFAFRSPPKYAKLLFEENFRILNIANNHAYDFGDIGFRDTINHLRKAGITVAGLPDTAAHLEVKGLAISVLGFTYLNRFNLISDIAEAAERVRQEKATGKYVIVTFHAGAEGPPAIWHENKDEHFLGENRGNTVAFSRAMVDAGADLIVGHGPHVLRAAECYRGKPIVYSLGNFVGTGGLSAKGPAEISAMLQVSVNTAGELQALNLVPLKFDERRVPYVDADAFGTRLVNYLGKHAKYAGEFIEFPVSGDSQDDFMVWLKTQTRISGAKK